MFINNNSKYLLEALFQKLLLKYTVIQSVVGSTIEYRG